MHNKITPLTWQTDLKKKIDLDIQAIDDDFMLFDNVKVLPVFNYPFRVDVTTFIICSRGSSRGYTGLKYYETTAPCMITLLAGEILQHEFISDDFEGLFIVMSKRLTDNLLPNFQDRVPLDISIRENPVIPLCAEDLDLLKIYYAMLKAVVEMTENPHRKEIIRHLMIAFHYHSSSWLHKLPQQTASPTKQEEVVTAFMSLAEKYYKTERQAGFYAEKLHLTPKYLSQIVKTDTGKSANEWIDEYVILEAKALLKSSKLSIQQIADELNFADQSVFGKYFKRVEGISPKEYRRK
ncbi:MAG: helix-turn-helix domain-containing protein [Dysgonamonadaceae bacterium]|jgi:AraC-like DNA-binding protein|nr:helix-turn-helix domain-containing protein [Dysgonamonadaceae bacterium]